MARPALGRTGGHPDGARPGAARLDPDRPAVDAARADPSRFDVLYRKYLAHVYNFAYYELGDHHDAEDVTERTFLAALTNLHRFEERARPEDGPDASTFRLWLFRIARNAVGERRRARRRHPETRFELIGDRPDDVDVAHAVERREAGATAWGAVRRLRGDRRRVIVLRFVHELSTVEIARLLGRSEGAVRVLLHRALRAVAHDLAADDQRRGDDDAREARP